jgi:hypothetical protein
MIRDRGANGRRQDQRRTAARSIETSLSGSLLVKVYARFRPSLGPAHYLDEVAPAGAGAAAEAEMVGHCCSTRSTRVGNPKTRATVN